MLVKPGIECRKAVEQEALDGVPNDCIRSESEMSDSESAVEVKFCMNHHCLMIAMNYSKCYEGLKIRLLLLD